MKIEKIISLVLPLVIVICSPTFAMRPVSAKMSKTDMIIAKVMKARTEIRSQTLSVMDIHFTDSFKETAINYFKDLGYDIERYNRTNEPQNILHRFDLIFWNMGNVENLRVNFQNVVHLMRQNGVLFVSFNDEFTASQILDFCRLYEFSYHREGNIFVIKRMFDDYTLFTPIVLDIKAMMETGRAA